MKKCLGYRQVAGSESAWVPCGRRAETGSKFCEEHTTAIVGAWLGLVVHAESKNTGNKTGEHQTRSRREDRNVSRLANAKAPTRDR